MNNIILLKIIQAIIIIILMVESIELISTT